MMEQTTRCPACGGEVQRATNKCNQCSFDLGVGPAPRTADKPADYGIALLAIPLVATLLVWFWVGNMNLFQSPGSTLGLIMVATVLGAAGVAAMEAAKAGMKTDRAQGTYSPTACFFIIGATCVFHSDLPCRICIPICRYSLPNTNGDALPLCFYNTI